MKNILLLQLFLFTFFQSFSQSNITLNANGNSNQCSGNFYDSGGSGLTGTGRYGNSQTYTWTICPTGTSLVSLNFTSFDVDAGDALYVYDGNSTAATSLGLYNNNVPLVGTVQATTANSTGCLTFKFVSNASTVAGGWVASITCVTPCQTVQAVSTPSLTPTAGIIKICQGNSVTFNGSGTYPQSGTYYNQSNATSTYEWAISGPNGTSTVSTQNTSQSFSTQGAYHIDLAVTDVNGCVSTNSQEIIVEVSTTPLFTGTGAVQPTICLGQTNTINGVVTPVTYTEDCTPPVGGEVNLPDGTGTAYSTNTTISCYASGQTITSASQISSICMNIEHSYLGDLDITITCPTGQTITLLDYETGSNTGGEFLGTPVDEDDSAPVVGVGANYCFTSTASQTMDAAASSVASGAMMPLVNYLPYQSFTGLVGCGVNGDWVITINDKLGHDNGYIFGWSVDFTGITTVDQVTFTPSVVSSSWAANSTIVSTSGNNIVVQPTSTGNKCYTYSMTDNFGCTYDTTVCFMVTASPTTTFNPLSAVCQYSTPPVLPTSSTNSPAITGTWSPAVSTSTVGTTTYTFTPTAGQCATTATLNLTVNASPTITINSPTICAGASATLTATPSTSGGTYLWSPGGQTTASITVSPGSTTSYSCVYTLSGCPSPSVTGTVTVNPIPTITINNSTICNGASATLTATPSATGGTYLWSPGGQTTASITISPSTTTSYSCIYTLASCPSPSVSGTVTVNPVPTITVNSTTVCDGTSATLTATPSATGGTYLWSPGGQTTASITVTPSTTTTYSCVYTLNGCPSTSISGTVTVNPIPTITVSNVTVCNGNSGTITATPSATGGTYLWSPGGQTTASITASPASTTSYSCVYTLAGCPSASVTGTITVSALPTVTVNSPTICNGSSGTITATPSVGGGTYLWSPGGETTASITVSPSATTSYSVVYSITGCSSSPVSSSVTVNPSPTITINNSTVCNGTSATLTATPSATGGTYLWSPGGQTTASISVTPSTTTSYSCVYTLAGCPSPSVSGTVTVNPIPTVTVDNQTVCNGTSATLTATPSAIGGTYLWSPGGETTNSITYTPSSTTSYSVVYTLAGCPSPSASGTITVNPIPTVTVNNQTVCNGTSATLTATPSAAGGTYLWSPGGETTNSITYTPSTTTSYSVVYTIAGCTSPSASGTITVNPIPTVTVNNQIVCNGTSATLTATPSAVGGTYLWSPGGETTNTIIYSPTSTTSYSVVYTLAGCPSPSASGTITVNPIPTVSVDNQTVCNGTSATLTATPSTTGGTYLWSPGGETTNSITYSPSSTTSYSVVYTLAGCPSPSASGTITVNPIPTVTVDNQTVCDGTSATLTATPSTAGGTYLWSPGGETTNSITYSPSSTTSYSVVYTLAGCPSPSASGTITVKPIPTINIPTTTICSGASGTLTATPSITGGTYLWSPGGETTNSITYSPSNTTSYSCIYTLNGCPSPSVTSSIIVTPAPTLSVNSPTVCDGTSAQLTATPSAPGGTYLWSPGGETTNTISVTPSINTTYSVTYSYSGCPTLTESGTVTVNPIPTVTVDNQTVCDGTSATLTATPSAPGGTYLWSPGGETTNTISYSPSSTTSYSVVYTLVGCPSPSASGTITVNQIPTLTIPTTTICNGASGTLTATPSAIGGTYLWSPGGETTNSITYSPSSTTSYSCVYTLNGCPSPSVTSSIIVTPAPTLSVNSETVCDGTSALLTATPSASGGTYSWDSGQTTASISVTPSINTTYTVTYSYPGCPTLTESGTVTVNPIPSVTVDNQTVCDGTSATLTATPSAAGGTYLWSPGSETTNTISYSPSTTTSYSVVYTLAGCPSPSASGTITVNPIPTVTVDNQTVCEGTSATLTATPSATGGTYLWSPGGETTNTISYSPVSTTTYSVIYTLAGCPSPSSSGTINVNPIPTVTVDNQTVCNGTNATLTATPSAFGGSYVWSPGGQTTNSITAAPSTTTTYSVVYTLAGCQSPSASGTINVNPIPTVTVDNKTVCNGTSAILTATPSAGGGTYLWSPGNETTNTITYSPSSTTSYSVVYTLAGCSSPSASGTINVNPIPTVTVDNKTVCNGTSAILTATPSAGGGTYLWSPGGQTTNSISAAPSTTTTYSVVYTLAGCPSPSASGTITINPIPTVTVDNKTVCNGSSATLTATPSATGGSYLWNPGGETTNTITNSPASTTSYSVVYTLAGCSSPSASGTITVNQIPTTTATTNAPICENENLNLFASNTNISNTIYSWTGPNGFTSTSQNPTVNAVTSSSNGTYTVSTTANGCNYNTTVNVIINVTPQIDFVGNILSGCSPLTVTFTNNTTPTGDNVIWDFGDNSTSNTNNNITHTYYTPGAFDVTLTSTTSGCTNTLTQNQYINVYPQAIAAFDINTLSNPITNPSFEFTNNSVNATSYTWIFGDGLTSSAINPHHTYINEAAEYTVTLIANNMYNCSDTAISGVTITDEVIFYVPNTFTPDLDNFNETFMPVFAAGVDKMSYTLLIFNRWGEILFESHDMSVGWNGTYGGELVQDDTYVWKLSFKEKTSDKKIERIGHVNVLK